ncbi:TonB-dependent receptor [Pseudomaricurvus alkylphenolicus]|uniref:TonB-dependent receptor n=1 Tax=Pseudomaricurvus alkylphenolicus TaxID=1306991 RepID=UPI00142283BB|nr:TonB-dependent receptor [Pseudomaricurvus alkylphenolicus]NIB42327.1 TonB-dependent receptor [Pseudomaricurvus alkylphenolicus]
MKKISENTLALVIAAAVTTPLQAQQLEEIVVTAQKRSESLQDVPISVSAMSGDKIAEAGMQRLDGVANYIPNFFVNEQPIADTINIRGITSGTQAGFEQSVGTFVDGVYRGRGIQSRFAFLDVGMVEVLRGPQGTLFGKNTVGGALNISSAAPTEELEASLTATYNVDFDETDISGYLSGPLNDSLRGRVAFMDRRMKEGWVENTYYDEDMPGKDEQAIRLRLEWDISDSTTAQFKVESGEFDNKGVSPYQIIDAGPLAAFGVEDTMDDRSSIGNRSAALDPGTSQFLQGDIEEIALQLDSEFSKGEFTAIVAHSNYEFKRGMDADFNPLDVARIDDAEDFSQNSVELRFVSSLEGPIQYITGIYYQESELEAEALMLFSLDSLAMLSSGGCLAAGGVLAAYNPATDNPMVAAATAAAMNTGGPAAVARACADATVLAPINAAGVSGSGRYNRTDQETESWAIFGQLDWEISDTLTATLGLRYTEEEKNVDQVVFATDFIADTTTATSNPLAALSSQIIGEFVPHTFNDLSRDEESLTWSANLQWDVNGDTMVYGSVSTGFKAGGFNTLAMGPDPDDADFEEEQVITFEVGSKMSLMDGAAELNVAVFRTEYDDLQAAVFTGQATFNVLNAAEAITQGIEIDGRWQVTDNLLLTGSLGWTDFEFESFPNQACTHDQFEAFREAVWAGGNNILGAFVNNGDCSQAGINDLAGRSNAFTPELSAVVSAAYSWQLGSQYQLHLVTDAIYTDETYREEDLDPKLLTDATTKINASLRLKSVDGIWEIGLIGKNLTDVDDDMIFGADTPLFAGSRFASINAPRSIALTASLNF